MLTMVIIIVRNTAGSSAQLFTIQDNDTIYDIVSSHNPRRTYNVQYN